MGAPSRSEGDSPPDFSIMIDLSILRASWRLDFDKAQPMYKGIDLEVGGILLIAASIFPQRARQFLYFLRLVFRGIPIG